MDVLSIKNVKNIIIIEGTDGCTISLTGTKKGEPVKYVFRKPKKINLPALPDNPVLVITKQNYIPMIVEGKEKIYDLSL